MVSLPVGTSLGLVTVSPECRLWRSVELLVHFLSQTGFRLADALRTNWSAIIFEFQKVTFPVAMEGMLSRVQQTDYAIAIPQRTKSDPLGTY